MSDYRRISTTAEVWAVIHASHRGKLRPFGSFSDPTGTAFGGDGTEGLMETSYGFDGSDYPIIEARTTWDISQDNPSERKNEQHEYWLCVARKTD